jgi:hypothetical protein
MANGRLSASRISASPTRRFSSERFAKIRVIARDFYKLFRTKTFVRQKPDSISLSACANSPFRLLSDLIVI